MKVLLPHSEYAMTFEEIGAVLGISAACAKQSCYNGLRKLKKAPRMQRCRELAMVEESFNRQEPEMKT